MRFNAKLFLIYSSLSLFTKIGNSTKLYTTKAFIYKYPIVDIKQKKMVNYISDPKISIIIGSGPAGSGKTLVATQEAIKLLKEKKSSKIVITRPLKAVEDEEIGFLPGSLETKMTPWVLPILDYFRAYYTLSDINKLKNQNELEIVPFAFMRGRTFDNSIIIADEMQNSSIIQMKLLLTRIGKNSKIIILGDLDQTDINYCNGLNDLLERFKNRYDNKIERYNDGFGIVTFDTSNIQRNDIIPKVLELYK